MNRQFFATVYKELRQRRWSIIAYCLVAFGFMWLYIAIFPSFESESKKFNELLATLPKAMLEAFNINGLIINSLESYIAARHLSFTWPIMAILLMVSFGGQTIAGEIERGTMATMLSLPISRIKIFFAKYFTSILVLVFFCIFSILTIFPLGATIDRGVDVSNVLLVTFISMLFGWVIMSASFMVSSFAKERSTVYFTIGGSLLVMYVLNIVSSLIESAEKLQYASIFYYYTPSDAIVRGDIDPVAIIVMTIAALVCTIVGAIAFTRRDIAC